MKKIIIILSIVLVSSNFFAQEFTSGKKKFKLSSKPKLEITKVVLFDENNNQKVEEGEECYYELTIKNNGNGIAKGVKINSQILEGSTSGFSFDDKVYVGAIEVGKEKKAKIPFSPGISITSATIKFKFEALDMNFYKSAPKFQDLLLEIKEKEVSLAVSWYYPISVNTTVDESKFKLKACIMSSNPVHEAKLYLNNQLVTTERGMILIPSNDCDYTLEKEITLEEGKNTLKLVIENQGKTVTSPIRVVTYEKKELENRLALIIGNSEYSFDPLKNPSNDAKAMAATLRNMDFDVIEIINGDKKTMREGVRSFYDKLKKDRGVGLFYYAGHGVQTKGENYLIPVKCDIKEEFDIPDEAIRVNTVLDYMEGSGARMNIVILDACRNNPFARSFRSGSRGLSQVTSSGSGSIIAFATSPGSVASDGEGGNGLYTQELLKAIETPSLEIGMIFRQVLTNVKKMSNGMQIPWTNQSIEGEFYFTK